ncbi:unnamed protein product, partial [Protopolystoma xenopodis]
MHAPGSGFEPLIFDANFATSAPNHVSTPVHRPLSKCQFNLSATKRKIDHNQSFPPTEPFIDEVKNPSSKRPRISIRNSPRRSNLSRSYSEVKSSLGPGFCPSLPSPTQPTLNVGSTSSFCSLRNSASHLKSAMTCSVSFKTASEFSNTSFHEPK